MTDRQLIQEYVKHGSERAFGLLVERHLSFVYGVCRREVDNLQIAEDAALAVFLLLAEKAKTIRGDAPLTSWLFTSARFIVRNAVRQEQRRRAREQMAMEIKEMETQLREVTDAESFVSTHLNDALASLSNRERDAILLRYGSDMEVSEVAVALGISESAAQTRLSRGTAKMRGVFARRGATVGGSIICSAIIAVKSEAAPASLAAKAASLGSVGLAGSVPTGATLLYKGAIKTMVLTKVKTGFAVTAAVFAIGGTALVATRLKAGAITHNAFDYFNRAGQLVQENGDTLANTVPSIDIELIAKNADTLKILRQGFAYHYTNPPITFSSNLPYFLTFRKLSRILVIDGRVRERSGDWAGAADSGLDAVQLGEEIPNGSDIMGKLVGNQCSALGRSEVWNTINHLSSEQALAAERRLEDTDANRVSFDSTLKSEQESIKTFPWTPDQAADRDAYVTFLHQWAEVTYVPYGSRPVLPKDPLTSTPLSNNQIQLLSGNSESPLPNRATIAYIETDSKLLTELWARDTADEVRTRELETALALNAYRSDIGRYPNSLSNLVPKYLNAIPADSFSSGGDLLYHITGDSYMLYSVGPDGVDDGGKPIIKPLKPDVTGDIVAGIHGS